MVSDGLVGLGGQSGQPALRAVERARQGAWVAGSHQFGTSDEIC